MKANLWYLNILHILNDGYHASFLILFPFIAQDFHLSLTAIGVLGTVYKALGVIITLPASYIGAKFGGMKIVSIAPFIYGAGFLLLPFAHAFWWLFPMSALIAIGVDAFHPIAFALIAKLVSKDVRGKVMGDFTAGGEIGKVGLPALMTVVIGAIGWRYTTLWYGIGILALSLVLYILFRKTIHAPEVHDEQRTQYSIKEIMLHRRSMLLAVTTFLDAFGASALFIFLPFFLLERGVSAKALGLCMGAYFLGNLLGKTMLGRFVDRHGTSIIFVLSEIFMAIFIVLLVWSHAIALVLALIVILGIFTNGTVPVIQAMVTEAAEHHRNFEKSFGINIIFAGVGGALAPVLLGYISNTYSLSIAFYTIAVMILVAIIPAAAFHYAKN